MSASLILDILIAVLLATTVLYCWKLSKRISLLHEGKEELNSFINDFNHAIIRAENNIQELKTVGEVTEENLQKNVQKARFLANDLSFLMDKGEHIADNLEKQIGTSRTITARPPVAATKRTNHSPQHNMQQTKQNIELPTATPNTEIAAPEKSPSITQSTPKDSSMSPSKKQALDDVLSKIATRKSNANNLPTNTKPENAIKNEQTPQEPLANTKPQDQTKSTPSSNPFNKRKLNETLIASQGD